MRNFLAFFVLGALLGLAQGQSFCPDGFLPFYAEAGGMETCFLFEMGTKRTWYEGQAYCKTKSASLANLDPGNLHGNVRAYIMSQPTWLDEGFHISGTDQYSEGYWVWDMFGTQTPMLMGPPHWGIGQPDGGTRENFACLYTPDFYYNSCVNNQKMYIICQI